MAAAHDLLNRLLEDTNLPDDVDAPGDVQRFIASKRPPFIVYEELLGYVLNSDMYVNGRVTRTGRYVHQRSTDFELETVDIPEENYAHIEKLANEVEKLIQAECYRINCKIYRALEREYDYNQADEHIAEEIEANAYTFDENGERDDGAELLYAQLDDTAKARARDWYRVADVDCFWSESIIDEWKTELENMGFDTVEIGWSGFSSQGDGASFTAKRFDLKQWTAWWSGPLPTEKGHPYTDDLPVAESLDVDSPELFDTQGFIHAPLERLAATLGFTRNDIVGQRRYVKPAADGAEIHLRHLDGDYWDLVLVRDGRTVKVLAAENQWNPFLGYNSMAAQLPSAVRACESLDSPEDFDLKGFINKPLARLALTHGFRATDHRGVRRFVKDLPDGTALWLTQLGPATRTPAYGDDWELTQAYTDRPQQIRAHANEEGMERLLPSLLKIHTYVAP